MNPKIRDHHRSRPAYIYLRQSTPGQVRHHQESTQRQYALREKALELGGFNEDNLEKEITVGFAHNAVLGVADKVIEAVRNKAIKHFFLIGGCDGAKPGRNYYTEFAENTPADSIILTLACGKFRINRLDYGEIGGIP